MAGWVNVDSVETPGVDLVADLDDPNGVTLPWADDSVDEFALIHCLEHINRPLPLMAELWRVAQPDAPITIACPYGSSDDADEDPTHVRRIFLNSFAYFGQPFYYRADYGYRGDWQPTVITLRIHPVLNDLSRDEVMAAARFQRNVVREMVARLTAVKPARPPHRDLQQVAEIVLERVREA
jgi:ubiquinone/menaquinone biosynthesis C-methylase UbiE